MLCIQSKVLILDRIDGLAKSSNLLAIFIWLFTAATIWSVYTKLLPQGHSFSVINGPATSTHLTEVRKADGKKASRHQKIRPDLDTGNQKIQPSHSAQLPAKVANTPQGISPQVMNTQLSYLIITHISNFSKTARVHLAQLLLGQPLWTGFQGDHPASCGLPKQTF